MLSYGIGAAIGESTGAIAAMRPPYRLPTLYPSRDLDAIAVTLVIAPGIART